MRIDVIQPHGFCAGVRGALEKALHLLSVAHEPVYCLHALVHNEMVTVDLTSRGMRFVETVDAVPEGAHVLFSAHGVSPGVRAQAAARHLRVTDATCPFVARVHHEAKSYSDQGLPVIIIGKRGHAETNGIVGECAQAFFAGEAALPTPGSRVGIVAQTTMNADDVAATLAAFRERYDVVSCATVCTATKERQDAIRTWIRARKAEQVGRVGVLVLGSARSSNTQRLAEIAQEEDVPAHRAGTLEEIRALDFAHCDVLGLSAGASTPESFLQAARQLFS